jgi:hypothetical protein
MGIERFLDDVQLLHGYTLEAKAEEMDPRRVHDSLPASIDRPVSRGWFSRAFHVNGLDSCLFPIETILVY